MRQSRLVSFLPDNGEFEWVIVDVGVVIIAL